MKMGAGLFWGIILIIIGVGMIIKVIFKVDFPIFKIIFAFFFIYLGLKVLFGAFHVDFHLRGNANDVIFTERVIHDISDNSEFNVIFGKAEFDLRHIELKPGKNVLKINTVFGGTEIRVNESIPLKIKAESVFGGANLPDGTTTGFGTVHYTSDNFDTNADYLVIYADVVFGGVQIRQ